MFCRGNITGTILTQITRHTVMELYLIQYSAESNYAFAQAIGEAKHPHAAFAQAKMLFNQAKSYCRGYCRSKNIAWVTAPANILPGLLPGQYPKSLRQ